LAVEITEIRAIGASSDLAAQNATAAFVERHRDLFPGDDGLYVAWAIVTDSYPPPTRCERWDGTLVQAPIKLFAEPVPPYSVDRQQRSARRRPDNEARTERLLALLRDLPRDSWTSREHALLAAGARTGMPPREVHRRLARLALLAVERELGMSARELHRELSRLRKRRDLSIPPAEHFSWYALFEAGLSVLAEEEGRQNTEPELTEIPVAAVESRTGMTLEELRHRVGHIEIKTLISSEETLKVACVPSDLVRKQPTVGRMHGLLR
jgi:hypothetical protein